MRHGSTNPFAAGAVFGACSPNRNGATFLAFLEKAVKPCAGQEVPIVPDNLSPHTTPDLVPATACRPTSASAPSGVTGLT
ncbi:hypothetical protein [Streptomyces brasiliscabiei]|uniref:hypothetical protein n=1 Tax=Streptomyces brasiliscabiei TaxID=2736302 RepID=UPI001C107823|nr:hypothetical protein [Streptomyces brasiliscabiei]